MLVGDPWGQAGYDVRCEWGLVGAARVSQPDDLLVIVDVLSFTTAVSVAVSRGAVVYPAPWGTGAPEGVTAVVAVGRTEVTAERPWSLSPASLQHGPLPARLVLPSPNGSAIAAAASGVVVAACLRNAAAVGEWARRFASVTVVPAGERWPDGSLRPSLEDALGAGAVIAALQRPRLSPEAAAMKAVYEGTASVPEAVRGCASGRELIEKGFAEDVELAVEVGVSAVVPVLHDGAFRQGAPERL